MAEAEIILSGSIVNRPIAAFSNPILRLGMPLLWWPISRLEALRKAFREPGGEASWAATRAGLKMFMAIVPIGLAYAAVMDEYDEEWVGKKSNIRDFGEGNDLLAAIEQIARVGTFGMAGELVNTTVNFAEGGDMRGLSLDRRVLFVNSFLSVLNAFGTLMRQGDATYSTVYRPLIQSLGGAGYMQYAQVINNVLDLDNPESRYTARLNAKNYLSTAGRMLNMDVRTGVGMRSLPNSIKPWVAEMSLAALADDAVGFQDAFEKAKQAAREEEKDDPVGSVKQSFTYQHPLRSVFRTMPTEAEYRRLLGVMNEDGRRDVTEAVRQFNRYAEKLGLEASVGKKERPKKKRTTNTRDDALMLLREF